MNIFRSKLLLGALVTVIAVPYIVSAQTAEPAAPAAGGSITQADMQELRRLEILAKRGGDNITNAINYCKGIGDKLAAMSLNKYSSGWTSIDKTCYFGVPIAKAQGELIPGRTFTVRRDSQLTTYIREKVLREGIELNAKVLSDRELAAASTDSGSGITDWIISIVKSIFVTVGKLIISVLAGVATLALWLLDKVISETTNTLAPDIVNRGWIIIRDFANLFFIISLIVMALATILRYEKYNYKQILARLVVAAVLINFSQIIAETFISVSDTLISLMKPEGTFSSFGYTIYSGFVGGGEGSAGLFGLTDTAFDQAIGEVVTSMIALIVLTVSIGAIAMMMFVRVFGLWFLIMVSPVAYAFSILPATRQLSEMWWKEFTKFLIWGPVAMFFFRLAYIFINEVGQNAIDNAAINSLFIAAFVYGGFYMAKVSGQAFSSGITSTAQKYMTNGSKMAMGTYGNLFWRGTVPGLAAGVAGGIAGRFNGKGVGVTAKEWYKGTQNYVGSKTAAVVNAPKLAQTAFITKPNESRKKLVDNQYKRMELRTQLMGDFDKDNANKIKDKDVDYLVDKQLLNVEKIKNIFEHGDAGARKRILAHIAVGKVGPGKGGVKDDAQFNDAMNSIRTKMWTDRGGPLVNLKHDEFMVVTKDSAGNTKVSDITLTTRPLKAGETIDKLDMKEIKADVPLQKVRALNEKIKIEARKIAETQAEEPNNSKYKTSDGGVLIPAVPDTRTETSEEKMRRIRAAGEPPKKS